MASFDRLGFFVSNPTDVSITLGTMNVKEIIPITSIALCVNMASGVEKDNRLVRLVLAVGHSATVIGDIMSHCVQLATL